MAATSWSSGIAAIHSVRGQARFGLGGLALFGATCVALGSLPWFGVHIRCPFLEVTGWLCPFCGATRMGHALLRGDLLAAWQHNAFVLLLALGCLAAVFVLARQLVTGRTLRLGAGRGALGRLARVGPTGWLLGTVGLGLLWMLLRNVAL